MGENMFKKLFLILVSFGMATEWGGSVSVRTPNDDTKPLDYELSIKLDATDLYKAQLIGLELENFPL